MTEISPYRRLQKNVALTPLSTDLFQYEIDRVEQIARISIDRLYWLRSSMVALIMVFLQVELFVLGAVSFWVFPLLGAYLVVQLLIRVHAHRDVSKAHWLFLASDAALLIGLRFFEELYIFGNPDITATAIALFLVVIYSQRCSQLFSKISGIVFVAIVIGAVSQGNYSSGIQGVSLVATITGVAYVTTWFVSESQKRRVARSLRLLDSAQLALAVHMNASQTSTFETQATSSS